MHTNGLTGSWSASVPPDSSFHSTKGKFVGSQCRAGEKQGASSKQVVSAAARMSPQAPSLGPASREQQVPQRLPCTAPLQKTTGARYRESAASHCVPRPYGKWVQTLAAQKLIKQQGWWEGKFALFLRQANGPKIDSPSPPPPLLHQWTRAFIDGGEGSTCKNNIVSSQHHLEIGRVAV